MEKKRKKKGKNKSRKWKKIGKKRKKKKEKVNTDINKNGKVVVVAFIQGHDIKNYRLMERIYKNVWKRPSSPPRRRKRDRAASALEPTI